MKERYHIRQDDSGHQYIIKEEHEDLFEEWYQDIYGEKKHEIDFNRFRIDGEFVIHDYSLGE